jgi:hypothetical protein
LYSQVAAGAPKRIPHDEPAGDTEERFGELTTEREEESPLPDAAPVPRVADASVADEEHGSADDGDDQEREEGPVHRPLIRASLPRPEGQPPPVRPAPDFTIRQPGGRPNRFRPRHQRGGGQPFHDNRSNGNIGGPQRGRPPQNSMSPRGGRRHGQGRKRSK